MNDNPITTDNEHQRVRNDTLQLMDELAEAAKTAELPEPPPVMDACREKLIEDQYRVLVVGEMKRGKSSFINALIGRRLLPTDVDVATCQVFHIRATEQEAFRLRLEDNSERAIEAEQLARYGSEVAKEVDGPVDTADVIRWIECDVPCRFLPPNLSIMDTPGMGSLYESHALITERFTPHADAVVFVLDALEPMKKQEAQFLEHILEITTNVFFVMTKIDLLDRDAWHEVRQRHEQILSDQFGKRLGEIKVWPVSSENMIKAAAGDDDAALYLRASCYAELEDALQQFLERVASVPRTQVAMATSGKFLRDGRNTLAGRLSVANQQSKQQIAEMQKTAADRVNKFKVDWGPQGRLARELVEEIRRCTSVGKQSFRDAFMKNGALETELCAFVDFLANIGRGLTGLHAMAMNQQFEAMDFAALQKTVASKIAIQWRHTTDSVQARCSEALEPFDMALETTVVPDEIKPEDGSTDLTTGDETTDLRAMLGHAFQYGLKRAKAALATDETRAMMFVGMVGGAVLTVTCPLALPVLGAVLGGVGFYKGGQVLIEQKKSEMKNNIRQLLYTYERSYFDADFANNRQSMVDEYFGSLSTDAMKAVQELSQRKLQEMNDELQRIKAQAAMNQDERKAEAERISEQIEQFDQLGQKLVRLIKLSRESHPPVDNDRSSAETEPVCFESRPAMSHSANSIEV